MANGQKLMVKILRCKIFLLPLYYVSFVEFFIAVVGCGEGAQLGSVYASAAGEDSRGEMVYAQALCCGGCFA